MREISALRYNQYVEAVRQAEIKRLGYPVVGAMDESDYDLGIIPGSAFDIYLNNIGNPYQIPSSFQHHAKVFEQEVIELSSRYLGLKSETRGYITSGGTEGNFAGIWWAREFCKNLGSKPILYISDAVHYSIPKIADQLALDTVIIPTTARGAIKLPELKKLLTNHPIDRGVIMIATAGTTQLGAIDNILSIRQLLNLHITARGGVARFHLDAALLGFAMPVLFPEIYSDVLKAVDSLAISTHKLLPSRMLISGLVLTSESYLKSVFSVKESNVSYIGDVADITVSGSRSGAAALSLHYRMIKHEFHLEGRPLKTMIENNLELANYLYRTLKEISDPNEIILGDNRLTLVFPRLPHGDAIQQKYSLMPIDGNRWGICVLSHVTREIIDSFIEDYRRLS